MGFGIDIHGLQRMNYDPLTFHLAPLVVQNLYFFCADIRDFQMMYPKDFESII